MALAFAYFTARLLLFVDRYAVNLLFGDQWSYYLPLFAGESPLRLFFWQWGAHRVGLGYLAIWALAQVSGWDSRYEAFFSAATVIVAALLALWLKLRLAGRLSLWDVAIPALCMTLFQYEVFLAAPALFNRVPLVLMLLYALCLTLELSTLRYALLLVLNLLCLYTGYGLFLGLITPPLLVLELVKDARLQAVKLCALGISLASLAAFFHGYVVTPSVDCFVFPDPQPVRYLQFSAMEFETVLGFRHEFDWRSPLPLLALLVGAGACAWQTLRARDTRRALPIAVLFACAFLFAANAAVGRVCLGLGAAHASRYVNYLIPGFLGFYLMLATLPGALARNGLSAAALAALLYFSAANAKVISERADFYFRKAAWADCYRRYEEIERCDQASRIELFAEPEEVDLPARLAYLKQHRLNLYKPGLEWSERAGGAREPLCPVCDALGRVV